VGSYDLDLLRLLVDHEFVVAALLVVAGLTDGELFPWSVTSRRAGIRDER